MENTQYLKYKRQFKINCILKAVAGLLALFALVFFIFVPNFKIKVIEGLIEPEFSLFDEIKLAFDNMFANKNTVMFLGIYQIIAIMYIAIACVMGIITLVKNIMNVINLENYALEEYDKLKTRRPNTNKRWSGKYGASNFLMSGILLEIVYIFLSVYLSGMWGESVDVNELSFFMSLGGVTWKIVFFIIFLVAFLTVAVINSFMYKKVKLAILKEDYGLAKTDGEVVE